MPDQRAVLMAAGAGSAGGLALLVILVLGLASVLLFLAMRGSLKRMRGGGGFPDAPASRPRRSGPHERAREWQESLPPPEDDPPR